MGANVREDSLWRSVQESMPKDHQFMVADSEESA